MPVTLKRPQRYPGSGEEKGGEGDHEVLLIGTGEVVQLDCRGLNLRGRSVLVDFTTGTAVGCTAHVEASYGTQAGDWVGAPVIDTDGGATPAASVTILTLFTLAANVPYLRFRLSARTSGSVHFHFS